MTYQFLKLPDSVLGQTLGVPKQTCRPEPYFVSRPRLHARSFWPSCPPAPPTRGEAGPLDLERGKATPACTLAGSHPVNDLGSCHLFEGGRLPKVS